MVKMFTLFTLLGVACTAYSDENKPQWAGKQEFFRKRAEELVSQMSLDEKINLYRMDSNGVERLNINPHHWWSEALHGYVTKGGTTQFPQAICIASTFNPQLIERMGAAIGDEARARHHEAAGKYGLQEGLTIWSPTINLARDPRWGRNEETYGEDPFLAGKIAVAYIKGLQGNDARYLKAVATVKHFVANNTEYNRLRAQAYISEQALRDYYLRPYRTAVRKGNVQSVMLAYNGINGVPCGVNKWLVTDVLRGEWGFSGTVVTDVGIPSFLIAEHKYVKSHEEAIAAMLKAGVDVECDWGDLRQPLKRAITTGLVDEELLDRAMVNNLTTRLQLGQIDPAPDNPYTTIPISVVGSEKHCKIALDIAQQGMVLLKNEPQNEKKILPVNRKKIKRILVAGPYANTAQLGGYSGTPTHKAITPLMGIQQAAGKDITVDLVNADDFTAIPMGNLRSVGTTGDAYGLRGEYFAGTKCVGNPKHVRIDKNVDFTWQKPLDNIDTNIPQPQFAVRWMGKLVPGVSGDYVIAGKCDDGVKIWLDGRLLVDDWSDHAIRRKESEAVKLTAGKEYDIRVEYYDAGGYAEAHLEWKVPKKDGEDKSKVSTPDEKEQTLVVYVGGFDLNMANEGLDMMDLELPNSQLEQLRELQAIYPKVVLVLNGGTYTTTGWVYDNIPAILQAWYPGQQGGHALADVLFGKISPSGRLPMTLINSTSKLPDFDDYEIDKGRTYMYLKDNVRYPFGYGLSYTDFKYNNIKLSKNKCLPADIVKVSVDISNTGNMDGDEVVQLYFKRFKDKDGPSRQLAGFKRVHIKKGTTETVSIELPISNLEKWQTDSKEYQVKPGKYELRLGSSSSDIRQRTTLSITDR